LPPFGCLHFLTLYPIIGAQLVKEIIFDITSLLTEDNLQWYPKIKVKGRRRMSVHRIHLNLVTIVNGADLSYEVRAASGEVVLDQGHI
jgi:hypothetical protein